MKTLIIFLFFNLIGLNVFCQTGEKFKYQYSPETGRLCFITLKAENPVPENAKYIEGRPAGNFAYDSLLHTYYHIVMKSIHPEKKKKLIEQTKFIIFLHFKYSISGKVLTIGMSLPTVSLNILEEEDLYILYNNLRNLEVDMTKIEMNYPPYWINGTEAYWEYACSIPI